MLESRYITRFFTAPNTEPSNLVSSIISLIPSKEYSTPSSVAYVSASHLSSVSISCSVASCRSPCSNTENGASSSKFSGSSASSITTLVSGASKVGSLFLSVTVVSKIVLSTFVFILFLTGLETVTTELVGSTLPAFLGVIINFLVVELTRP